MVQGGHSVAAPQNFLQIIQGLSLATDLQCCVDIAAAGSIADKTQEDVLDLTSNNVDFYLGADGSASTDDPEFVGTEGDLLAGTYIKSDAGDFCTVKSQPAFIETFHKANAALTIAGVVNLAAVPSSDSVTGTCGTNSGTDGFHISCPQALSFVAKRSNSTVAVELVSSAQFSATVPQFFAVALNEATGTNGATLDIHGTQESKTSTYTSPVSTSADHTLKLMQRGDGIEIFQDESRLHMIAFWDARLTDQNLVDLKAALFTGAGRFA